MFYKIIITKININKYFFFFFLHQGTVEERMAVLNAARYGVAPSIRYAVFDMPRPEMEDVSFDLQEIEKIMIGQPFTVTVKVQNKNTSEMRTVSAVLSASTVYYTGILAKKVTRQRGKFTLKPNQGKPFLKLKHDYDCYIRLKILFK